MFQFSAIFDGWFYAFSKFFYATIATWFRTTFAPNKACPIQIKTWKTAKFYISIFRLKNNISHHVYPLDSVCIVAHFPLNYCLLQNQSENIASTPLIALKMSHLCSEKHFSGVFRVLSHTHFCELSVSDK